MSINAQIKRGEELTAQLSKVDTINGVPRLQRLIQQEINFLQKVQLTELQLFHSNTTHAIFKGYFNEL